MGRGGVGSGGSRVGERAWVETESRAALVACAPVEVAAHRQSRFDRQLCVRQRVTARAAQATKPCLPHGTKPESCSDGGRCARQAAEPSCRATALRGYSVVAAGTLHRRWCRSRQARLRHDGRGVPAAAAGHRGFLRACEQRGVGMVVSVDACVRACGGLHATVRAQQAHRG